MSLPAPSFAAPSSELAPEPCPTPLAWQQVLDEFRAGRKALSCTVHRHPVVACTFGSGRPLCFLNPAAGDHELFALTAWLLRDEFECLFFDYPPVPPLRSAHRALNFLGETLRAVMDAWGQDRCALLSAGFGSFVALHQMGIEPERIDAAVLVCGSARRRFSFVERGLLAWGTVWPGAVRHIPGWLAVQRQNHRCWFPPFDATRWAFLLQDLGATSTAQLARRMSVMGGVDLRPSLPDIRQPVLLIRTEGEGAVTAGCQEELAAGLPHVRSEVMPTTGQLPYLTHPHRLAKLVRSFLIDEQLTQTTASAL